MPCSSAEEFVALDGFERGEGRDEIDQGEAMTTDESTVSRATRPQTLSVILNLYFLNQSLSNNYFDF